MPDPSQLYWFKTLTHRTLLAAATLIALIAEADDVRAGPIIVANSGFEDLSGQAVFNEFTFGTPNGWSLYDPSGVILNPGTFTGTLQPNGVDFFNTTAPEGVKVGILFNSGSQGDGEYGYEQTLADTLQANTTYELLVEVGNIASGFGQNGAFFNLDEFPGYRVELLAGDAVIAQDNNALVISEAEFATSTVSFNAGAAHPQLGLPLGIRLVNLNAIPPGFTQATSPDLEVDYDDIRLSSTPTIVPEPTSALLMGMVMAFCVVFIILRRWSVKGPVFT